MTRRPDLEPRLDLVAACWQYRAPSGRVLTCALYRTAFWLELRVGYSGDDLLYSTRAVDAEVARSKAEELRAAPS